MTTSATYDAALSRVVVACTSGLGAATTAIVERSLNGIRWTTVRGGQAFPVSSGAFVGTLSDYEFQPDVVNSYRVRAGATTLGPVTVTPVLDSVWLKSIARPFLNREIMVTDYSAVSRTSRAGVFNVIGASSPIAVNDVMTAPRFSLSVLTTDAEDEHNLDLVLASGDTLLVQVPATCRVPGGYVSVADPSRERHTPRGEFRFWEIPCQVVRAPGPDVVGALSTWQTVINTYGSWSAVIAAHPTWTDLLTLIGSPEDVVVD